MKMVMNEFNMSKLNGEQQKLKIHIKMLNLPIQWHLEADGTFLVAYTYSGSQYMASLQVGSHGPYLMNYKTKTIRIKITLSSIN